MKSTFSAAIVTGAAMLGLMVLAPASASAMPVATDGVHAASTDLTQVRWHGHVRIVHRHHRHYRNHYWNRGHHYGWRHHHWNRGHHYGWRYR